MEKLICVPITERAAGSFWSAFLEAASIADLCELRLDYLENGGEQEVLKRLEASELPVPVLLTRRPREQGGMRDLTLADRIDFWNGLPAGILDKVSYVDFELDLVEHFATRTPPVSWQKVICSNHDFAETPPDIARVFERICATPAGIAKIASTVNEITDCVRLFELMDGSRKPFIVLGMGISGIATRVLALARGALLTFGALRRGAESASGQPTASELKKLYRAGDLDCDTEVYGVVANPVGHSRSPLIHNAAFRNAGRNAVYLPFEVRDLGSFLREMVSPESRRIAWNLKGLSVTIPHKLAIIPYLDEVDGTARSIGAVNTVAIRDGKLFGYNTDVEGAMGPLAKMLDLKGARAVVIGAGGAARAICAGLRQRGAEIEVFARDPARAGGLGADFGVEVHSIGDFDGGADLIINCTPVGMTGHDIQLSPVKSSALKGTRVVFDLIYAPAETRLLKEAREAGCAVLGGAEMLIGQAAEQFRIWTAEYPNLEVMKRAFEQGVDGL